MITFKNHELQQVLVQLMAFDVNSGKPVSGLLLENLTLGLKRRLQKIHAKTLVKYTEYASEVKNIETQCAGDMEKLESEINDLNEEPVTIDVDPVDIKFIEAITTTQNYNFDIIEKFAV